MIPARLLSYASAIGAAQKDIDHLMWLLAYKDEDSPGLMVIRCRDLKKIARQIATAAESMEHALVEARDESSQKRLSNK